MMPADLFPCSLFHAAPLHYLARILGEEALYAQSVLRPQGIAPRASACRRDRMLGLDDYVHLSLTSHTPLLADKMRKGYPHVLLQFDRAAVLGLPCVALVPFNAKAWFGKAAFGPVTDPAAQEELLLRYARTGRPRSLAVLVKYGLSLTHLTAIAFACERHREAAQSVLDALPLAAPAPLRADLELFPPNEIAPDDGAALSYFACCRKQRRLLAPPPLAFD